MSLAVAFILGCAPATKANRRFTLKPMTVKGMLVGRTLAVKEM